MTEQARRKRRRSCEWCGDLIIDGAARLAADLGYTKAKKRIDTRFCSPSCRQQSYSARKFTEWNIDGESVTGQQLVDRGWTLASKRDPRRKHSQRRIVAFRPGQETHPVAEMRPYRPRSKPAARG